jgi:2-polyprenyl-3-methyl-5-hydroxy-6-metoxy-1,4-benzoquinol methylase
MTASPFCSICGSAASFAFEKNRYKLYRCANCKHLFVYPAPTSEEITAVYKESYFHKSEGQGGLGYADYDSDKAGLASTFDKYLTELAKLAPGKKILDVGSATGFFLDRAKKAGWQTHGVEIAQFGAAESNKRGHETVCGTIEDVPGEARFDVITMWDVFEHMSDPQRALNRAHELLASGGIIGINTIDSSSVPAKMLGKQWHLVVPPEHLQYYSRTSLRKIVEKNGFEILTMHRITKRFSLAYIFTTLYRWQHVALWRTLAEFSRRDMLQKLFVPLQTFDNIYVLARKRDQ